MKKSIILASLIGLIVVFASCTPVKISGNKAEIKNHKRMVLLEFIVAPHIKPIFPLLDAAYYNTVIDDIIPEILICNKSVVYDFEKFFGEAFTDYSKFELLYGDSLRANQDYLNLKNVVQVYSTNYDDNDFPKIHIPENAYNFFPFVNSSGSNAVHPLIYFSEQRLGLIRERITKVCNALKVDGAIVVVTGVFAIPRQSWLMAEWDRANQIQMNFFDGMGKCFLCMNMVTPVAIGSPKEIGSYEKALKNYYRYSDFMLNVLFDKVENKTSSVRTFRARFDTAAPKIKTDSKAKKSKW